MLATIIGRVLYRYIKNSPTAAERLRATATLIRLSEDTMTSGELIKHIYHAIMLEVCLVQTARAGDRVKKHAKWLDNDLELIKLRRELTHL